MSRQHRIPRPPQPTSAATQQRRSRLINAQAGSIGTLLGAGPAHAAADPATLAEPKRKKAGRCLMAVDGPAHARAQGGAGKVPPVDLRAWAEARHLGIARGIDAVAPCVEHQGLMGDRGSRGSRSVDGLKHTGLPWSCALERDCRCLAR